MTTKPTFRYNKYLPAPALRSHISWFYTLEYSSPVNAGNIHMPALANPACALVINYEGRYQIENKYYRGETLPAQFFSGISTGPYNIQLSSSVKSLGIIFKTSVFRDVFGLPPLEELSDRRADATLFRTQSVQELSDQLANLQTDYEKIWLVNRFFIQAFGPILHHTDIADRIAATILNARGFISMDALAAQHYVSSRHLRRLFGDRYGISPKMYARIKRFGYAYFCMHKGESNWRNYVTENGFYDQAHLIKEFQTFSGRTPSDLHQAWNQVLRHSPDA
jgi:AraC-like DNA-binding protein